MTKVRVLLGLSPYEKVWHDMQTFTEQRQEDTENEIWQVEHESVYTLGQAGKPEHILNPRQIPVVHCNRGGQVTYHGPGQSVIYPLINLTQARMFVKEYVRELESAIIATLRDFGIDNACRKPGAPGVYVPLPDLPLTSDLTDAVANAAADATTTGSGDLAKIAALGVKVSRGCTYHGLAINVDMDLRPFDGINPCGYAGLKTIDMKTLGVQSTVQAVADTVTGYLLERF